MNRVVDRLAATGRGAMGGFTLMELLVVIAIVGILSSVVLSSLTGARQKGRDAKRISDIKQLQLALGLYYDVHNSYPNSNTGTAPAATTQVALANLVTESFISAIPDDPSNNKDYYYISNASSNSISFCLGVALEGTSNTEDTCNIPDFAAGTCGGADCTFKAGP